MAVGPLKRPKQPTTGYDSSGITAGTPYGQPRPLNQVGQMGITTQVDMTPGVGLNYNTLPAGQGYDGSGINPQAGRPMSLDQMSVQTPNGPMPTVPPGGIPTTPVPSPQANGLTLPGINGQQYVATSNGGAPAGGATFPAGPAPYTAPTVPGYTAQPVSAAPGQWTPAPITGGSNTYTPTAAPAAPSGYAGQAVPGLGQGWTVPDQFAAAGTVNSQMGQILDGGGAYMQSATRRGLETAAARGLLNSSIASGAAQRSAIDAAAPLLSEAMNTLNNREGMKFTQGENSLDRTQQERLQIMDQNFQGGENAADRTMSERLQTLAQNFQGSENASDRNAAQLLQQLAQNFQGGQNSLDRTQQERILGLTQNFQGTQAQYDRELQSLLTTMGINADLTNSAANRNNSLQLQREGNAFAGEQNELNRVQNVNDALLNNQLGLQNMSADYYFRSQMANDATMQQDWLQSQSFSREFNAALSMIPIANAADLNNYLMQAAINEPEVYTPEVMSGMSNFFNTNLQALLAQYFPEGMN